MTPQTFTKTLLAALMLTTTAQASPASPALRSKIAQKEQEITRLQAELTSLKSQLAKTNQVTYTVKAGDTLSSIARRHGISPAALIEHNNLTDPSRLLVGQTLTVGEHKTRTVANSAPKKADYIVKKGDTFYSIARRHQLTVSKLQKLNPDVNASRIAQGQKLVVNGMARVASKSVKKRIENVQMISTKKKVTQKPTQKKKATKKPVQKPMAKKKRKPAPTPAPVVKKDKPKPAPAPPVIEEPAPAPSSVSSIILTSETTFDAFASKHGTTTEKLNELNGWNLPKSTTLARGSEIYVPK